MCIMKNRSIFFIACLMLSLSACTDENFLLITELPEKESPTVIVEDNFLNFRQDAKSIRTGGGFAFRESQLNIDFIVISADSIECVNGAFVTPVNDYVLSLFTSDQDPDNFVLATSIINSGESTGPIFGGTQFIDCDDHNINIDITTYTDSLIAGTVETNYWMPDSTVIGGNNDPCEDYINMGLIKIEFSLPVEECN